MQPEGTDANNENVVPTPQPESQPMFVTPPTPEEQPKKKRPLLPIIIAIVLFLFVTSSAVAGYFAYQKIYLSPERVLGKMFTNYNDVKSYSYGAKVNLQSNDPSLRFDLDLLVEGKADLSDDSMPKNYGKYDAYINKLKIGELEYTSLSKDIYLKLNYLLSFGYKIDSLKNVWIKINTDELAQQLLGEKPEVLQPEEEELANLREELAALIEENPPFNVVEDLGSEDVSGHPSFHYKLDINKDNLLEYLQTVSEAGTNLYANSMYGSSSSKYQTDSYKNMLEEVNFNNVELWVDKKDYLPRKLVLALSSNKDQEDFNLSIEFTLDNYNQDQGIVAPADSISTEQFMTNLQQVFTNPQEDTNEFMDLYDSLYGDIRSQQSAKTKDTGRKATLTQLGHTLEAYATVHNGFSGLTAGSWITDLVAAGEIHAVPKPIENSTCDGISENGICFATTGTGVGAVAVIYTDVEAADNKNLCTTGTDLGCIASVTDPIWAYSTANGRVGLVCANKVSATELTFCDQ